MLHNGLTLVALDSSSWLDLLRIEESAASETLDFLESIDRRIVTPPTVVEELSRLGPQKVEETINASTRELKPITAMAKDTVGPARTQYREAIRAMHALADSLHVSIRADVEARYLRIASLTSKTSAPPVNDKTATELMRTREDRFLRSVPPGFSDQGKGRGNVVYNDLYIWFELMQIAEDRSRDIAFFTSERKADWWQKSASNTLTAALPALRAEMRQRAGQRFALYYGGLIVEQFEAARSVAGPIVALGGLSVADLLGRQTIESRIARQFYEFNARFDKTFVIPEHLNVSHWVGHISDQIASLPKNINDHLNAVASSYFKPIPDSLKIIRDLGSRLGLPSGTANVWPGASDLLASATRELLAPLSYSKLFAEASTLQIGIADVVRRITGLHDKQFGTQALGGNVLRAFGVVDPSKFAWALTPSIASLHQAFDYRHYDAELSKVREQLDAFQRGSHTLRRIDPAVALLARLSGPDSGPTERRVAALRRHHHSIQRRSARRRLRGRRVNLLRNDLASERIWAQ